MGEAYTEFETLEAYNTWKASSSFRGPSLSKIISTGEIKINDKDYITLKLKNVNSDHTLEGTTFTSRRFFEEEGGFEFFIEGDDIQAAGEWIDSASFDDNEVVDWLTSYSDREIVVRVRCNEKTLYSGFFANRCSLIEVDIPNTWTVADNCHYLFANCSQLKKANIRAAIKADSTNWFLNCSSLQDVVIENCPYLPSSFFKFCNSLKHVKLPTNMYAMGKSPFFYSGVESLSLPDGMQNCDFRSVFHLRYLRLPSTVGNLFDFNNCINLRPWGFQNWNPMDYYDEETTPIHDSRGGYYRTMSKFNHCQVMFNTRYTIE